MPDVQNALPAPSRGALRRSLASNPDPYIAAIPKVELHVHIEGTLSADLKWRFAQRNGIAIPNPLKPGSPPFTSLEELREAGDTLKVGGKKSNGGGEEGKEGEDEGKGQYEDEATRMTNEEETLSFFDAYYGGFDVLRTREDYEELAWEYYQKAASEKVRYAEIFFDAQGHVDKRKGEGSGGGIRWEEMMGGFRAARERAVRELELYSSFILCLLRDSSPASAMRTYEAALPHRDLIIGIGLDSNEADRPPSIFDAVFTRARRDGFRITAHCDVGSSYPLSHIQQAAFELGGPLPVSLSRIPSSEEEGGETTETEIRQAGLDRIDHGLNAASSPSLLSSLSSLSSQSLSSQSSHSFGLTICPWSYIRHQPFDQVFTRIRALFDARVPMAIGCDDPAYMEDAWLSENLALVKRECGFGDREVGELVRGAVGMCWAAEEVKRGILRELEGVSIGVDGFRGLA